MIVAKSSSIRPTKSSIKPLVNNSSITKPKHNNEKARINQFFTNQI